LYNTNFFHVQAEALSRSLIGDGLATTQGYIKALLFPGSTVTITFAAIKVSFAPPRTTAVDAASGEMLSSDGSEGPVYMIDASGPSSLGLLERYLTDASDDVMSQDPSSFIHASLSTGMELLQERGVGEGRDPCIETSLTHQQDFLLAKAIHLWVASAILSSSQSSLWSISYALHEEAVSEGETLPGQASHTSDASSLSYAIIRSQLLALLERHCAKLSKTVMLELEKRLVQRQHSSAFTTLLVTVIYLNCVERTSFLYRSLAREYYSYISVEDNVNGPALNPHMKSLSTLDYPPLATMREKLPQLWRDGESMGTLLNLLLRVRGLPPHTMARADGSLVVLRKSKSSFSEVLPNTGSADVAKADPELADLTRMSQWLSKTGVTMQDLYDAMAKDDDTPLENGGWDLRFIAPLLVPQ